MGKNTVCHFDVELSNEVAMEREADYTIDTAFLERWSPRAFSNREVGNEILMRIFEAARWAASSQNEQPWRFIVACKGEDLDKFVSFLAPANKIWAQHAPVLVLLVGQKTFSYNGKDNKTFALDCGTASGYMTLACTQNGLIAHGMAGFDGDMARAVLGIPSDFEPLAVYAIGYRGDKSRLPEKYQEREKPSGRRPVKDSIMEGKWLVAKEFIAEDKTETTG